MAFITTLLVSALSLSAGVSARVSSRDLGLAPLLPHTSLVQAATCKSTAVSCENTTAQNTCCFNAPGGVLLQTQFWDTDVSGSPADSWTIHGLWPDECDGSYQEDCDPSRAYTNISAILKAAGATSTLDYMKKYWLNDDGTSEELWEHEWETHGTCISTFDVDCYSDYKPQEEVVQFFETVVSLFKNLTTYDYLSAAGITPSSSKTYTLSELNAAVKSGWGSGVDALFGCEDDAVDTIEYFFHVRGTAQAGTYIPIAPVGSSSCPSSGISYPPKESSKSKSKARSGKGKKSVSLRV